MNKQDINLIGGCFQHGSSSTDNSDPQYINWLKESNKAPISIYVDAANMYGIYDTTKKNYGWLCESKTIIGDCYDWCRIHVDVLKEKFITVFTHDAELAKTSNIFTLTQCSFKSTIVEQAIYDKTKLVSMIASSKTICPEHLYRQYIINKFRGKCDHFGTGYNPIKNKIDGLKDYCFSIAMENATYPDMITEKLTDCFTTGTIPIYFGIKNINDFFNGDGIITLDDNFKIEDLSFELYYSKMGAIKDNFEIAKKTLLAEDFIYKNFIEKNL